MKPDQKFVQELTRIGILSYKEQETLWTIAQRCAAAAGIPTAGSGVFIGKRFGAVTAPGYGTVPGDVVGVLLGLFCGTLNSISLGSTTRNDLKDLAKLR